MAKSRLPKLALYSFLTLAVAGSAVWYFVGKSAEKAPEVSTVPVSRGEVTMVVTASGSLEAVTSVEVSSQVSGLIKEVLVDYNTPVKQGAVLARLDPATYDQRLKQSLADLASTLANVTLTRLNTRRTTELHSKGLATDQERDQADALLAQAEAQLLTRQASVEDARVNLSRCTIYAPIDGIVMDRSAAEVGKTVAASLNAPTLFIIANELARMQIVAAIAEADIGNISVGQQANFTVDAYPNRQFRGKVSQIRNYPKTASNVVTYETIIDVNNEDLKLKPGMTANVSVVVSQRSNTLRLPNSALRARVPESMVIQTKTAEAQAPAEQPEIKKISNEERRRILGEIFQQVGFSRENGPPSPEVLQKIQALAKEKGIDFDPSRFGGGHGRQERQQADAAPVMRTVYRLVTPSDPLAPKAEALSVKLGITDGINTEIVEGLAENDTIITSVISDASQSGATTSTNPMNPFSGGNRSPQRR